MNSLSAIDVNTVTVPSTELSQTDSAFYVISKTSPVETTESQGNLPHLIMQTPAIETAVSASSGFCQFSEAPSKNRAVDSGLLPRWDCLPLQTLHNFETVEHQFAASQVWFDSAIAIRPSNPYFQLDDGLLAVMPLGESTRLKITLGSSLTKIDIGFMSSQPIKLALFDASGHCLAMAQTPDVPLLCSESRSQSPHEMQGITLDTCGATILRIDAAAPFVLTRFWVQ